MKLTAFTDYSLRVLIYLAAQPERRATIAEISAVFDLKANHLTKVVHHLGKCGWVTTVRGKGGGLTLGMPAQAINIGRVVRDTEGAVTPAECFATDESHCIIDRNCRLKGVLAEAVAAFYGVLDRYTLADITRNQAALAQVIQFHRAANE
ncbi:Rrf2 family transcriptional regulator [Pelomonas cellulosilytica]|uniref:Rrf2 family transcriptional regulator n=1 Tax=Pelomonas cellulosilytica TaxID=2906762 RepID=A0ABS8XTW7_9BURK|nr:Rrf2 family transcriptional regulator [Pelomonas sp. P8]MCE4554658.1 Rrf2 family transcriptional regulator [Pelomonas sp. P8]